MPCDRCEHCRQVAELSQLRLPRRDAHDFLLRFAAVYRQARGQTAQPAKLIREANPSLTSEQVKWYRRRAVELGLLDRVGTRGGPVAPVAGGKAAKPAKADKGDAKGVELDPMLAMFLANDPPAVITPALIRSALGNSYPDEASATAYLQRLQEAGLVPAPEPVPQVVTIGSPDAPAGPRPPWERDD